MRICPDCNTSVSDSANFCDNCGYPFQNSPPAPPASAVRPPSTPVSPLEPQGPPAPAAGAGGSAAAGVCSACGYQNIPGEMFCQNCGVQLAPVASTPPPPPRPLTGPRPVPPPPVSPASAGAPAACPSCGSSVEPDDVFCPNCGMLLTRAGAASAAGDISPSPSTPQRPAVSQPEPPSAAPAVPFPPASPPVMAPPATAPSSAPISQPVALPPGRLVVRESGAEIALPGGRAELVIGRSDPVRGIYPEVDLASHGGDTRGVSRRHARLHVLDGRPQIEDLNSTNYTFLNRERLLPGQSYPLKDGDEIRVGLLALEYRQP